eukprot:2242497-Rhodomonas_salina.2
MDSVCTVCNERKCVAPCPVLLCSNALPTPALCSSTSLVLAAASTLCLFRRFRPKHSSYALAVQCPVPVCSYLATLALGYARYEVGECCYQVGSETGAGSLHSGTILLPSYALHARCPVLSKALHTRCPVRWRRILRSIRGVGY